MALREVRRPCRKGRGVRRTQACAPGRVRGAWAPQAVARGGSRRPRGALRVQEAGRHESGKAAWPPEAAEDTPLGSLAQGRQEGPLHRTRARRTPGSAGAGRRARHTLPRPAGGPSPFLVLQSKHAAARGGLCVPTRAQGAPWSPLCFLRCLRPCVCRHCQPPPLRLPVPRAAAAGDPSPKSRRAQKAPRRLGVGWRFGVCRRLAFGGHLLCKRKVGGSGTTPREPRASGRSVSRAGVAGPAGGPQVGWT